MSPIVRRALLRFHHKHAELRLAAGEDVGAVVDDFLRYALPLMTAEDLRPLLDALESREGLAPSRAALQAARRTRESAP